MDFSEKELSEFKKINTNIWNEVKENIYCRLINAKYLDKYGKNIAHTNFLDLACTFSLIEKNKDTYVTHMITNEDLEKYNVSLSDCISIAKENTKNNKQKRICTLKESMLMDTMMYPFSILSDSSLMGSSFSESSPPIGIVYDKVKDTENILVVKNKNGLFGAAYFMLSNVLDEVYKRFNSENFYIIPVSIHQVWCVRQSYVTHNYDKSLIDTENDLLDFIEEFNDTQNESWNDILSYRVYYYIGDDGKYIFPIKH